MVGEKKAYELPNRGPIRFDATGNVAADILDAYSKYGFYVFEGVLKEEELNDIKQDLEQMRETFPAEPYGKVTRDGKPALGADCQSLNLIWAKPLGDPLGVPNWPTAATRSSCLNRKPKKKHQKTPLLY